MQALVNRARAASHGPYPAELRKVLNLAQADAARAAISAWPGYSQTPLHALQALASELGIAALFVKDEGPRFGLGSFKALGGAYAVSRALLALVRARDPRVPATFQDLLQHRYADLVERITVVTATDGNHGRAVAWGARCFGCKCVVYLHERVSPHRERAIANLGATIVRVPGNYDDSVARAAQDARRYGWVLISDTSFPGYHDVPRDVMHGYMVIAAEALEELGSSPAPTHVFVQGGVGGFAAAVCAYLWERYGRECPLVIIVEPENADCLYRSAAAGRLVHVTGALDTIMAGLACGVASELAWEVLSRGAYAFLTVSDEAARNAMRTLARSRGSDASIVAGESGAAGLAGLQQALAHREVAALLSLGNSSRVLLVNTENDTDPASYSEIVGVADGGFTLNSNSGEG